MFPASCPEIEVSRRGNHPLNGFRLFALIGSLAAAHLLSAQTTASPPPGGVPGTASQTTTSPVAPTPAPASAAPSSPGTSSPGALVTPSASAKVRSTHSTVASVSPAVDNSLLPAPEPLPTGKITLMCV